MTTRERPPINYVRRGMGVLAAFAPIVILVASLLRAGGPEHSLRHWIAVGVMVCALLIGLCNVYLSFRPWIHERAKGSLDGYRHVSAIPVLGTSLVVVGAIAGFGSTLAASLGLLAVGLDIGGLPWFVVFLWRDSSFWDA